MHNAHVLNSLDAQYVHIMIIFIMIYLFLLVNILNAFKKQITIEKNTV